MHPAFHDVFYQAWKSTPFLKDLSLPTYFLIIFPLFIISILIFGLLAKSQKINLPDPVTEVADGEKPSLGVPKWQKTASTSLFIIAGICLVADTVHSINWQSPLVPILAEAGKETREIRETLTHRSNSRHISPQTWPTYARLMGIGMTMVLYIRRFTKADTCLARSGIKVYPSTNSRDH
jgi:hypothetical protein